MKPYGYKKTKKVAGDGCFLCTLERKQTKSAKRGQSKKEIKSEFQNIARKRKGRIS